MTTSHTYDMYPYRNQGQTEELMLRASREEALAKGWELEDEDVVAATNVAVAHRIEWEASHRPLSAEVSKAGELALKFH